MRLNGWQRIWIVLVVILFLTSVGLSIGYYYEDQPRSRDWVDRKVFDYMQPENLKKIYVRGNSESAWGNLKKNKNAIRRLTEEFSAQTIELRLSEDEIVKLSVLPGMSNETTKLILEDYMSARKTATASYSAKWPYATFITFAASLGISLLLYLVSWLFARIFRWVSHGFQNK